MVSTPPPKAAANSWYFGVSKHSTELKMFPQIDFGLLIHNLEVRSKYKRETENDPPPMHLVTVNWSYLLFRCSLSG